MPSARERSAFLHSLYRVERSEAINRVKEAQALQPLPGAGVMLDDLERRYLFLSEVGAKLTAKGTDYTIKWLWRVYRISRKQAGLVVSEARRELSEAHRASVAELRGIASARLEDQLRRARNALDIDLELKITKEWMALHGLKQGEDQGAMDLASIMRKISASDGAGKGKVIDAEYTVDGEAPKIESWSLPGEWEPVVKDDDKEDDGEG